MPELNRKDKRKYGVADNDPSIMMKESELLEMRRKTREVVIFEVSRTIIAVLCVALKDEHNFGERRINKMIDRIYSQLDCVLKNTVTRDEIFKWCRDNKLNFEGEHKKTTLYNATASAING